MRYPYPSFDKQGNEVEYVIRLPQATKTRAGATFCNSLDKIDVIHLDAVAQCFSPCRMESYSSADALFEAADGRYFFIEFKHNSFENLMRQGRKGDPEVGKRNAAGAAKKPRPTIQVVMHKKAVDSLCVAALSVLRSVCMKDIQQNAVFVTVHDSGSKALQNMARGLRRLACSTVRPPATAPLWGLQDLIDSGLYREVYTWDESEFCARAATFLK